MVASKPSSSRLKRWAKRLGRRSGDATDRNSQSSREAVVPLSQVEQLADATIPADQLSSNVNITSPQDQAADTAVDNEALTLANEQSPSAGNGDDAPGLQAATEVQVAASDSLWKQALKRIRASEVDPDVVAEVLKLTEQATDGEYSSAINSAKDIQVWMERQLEDMKKKQKTAAWKISIHRTSYSLDGFIERTVAVLNRFVAVGDVAVSFDPVHAALPWAAVRFVLVIQNLTARSKLASELTFGLAKVTTLASQCSIYQTLYGTSKISVESQDVLRNLEETIVDVHVQSLLFLGFAVLQGGSNHFMAVFKLDDLETHNQKLLDVGNKLSQAAENCEKFSNHHERQDVNKMLQLARDSHLALQTQQEILLDIRKYTLLSTLRHAKGAAYDFHANENDPRCHPDTRVDLLHQVQQWVRSDDSEPIFWLEGKAGTGKSTIARTVAATLDTSGELGANFFFKRGEGDRSRAAYFFTTISKQLCQRVPSFAESVQHAIEADPEITEKSMPSQFEKLIYQPLESLSQRGGGKSRMTVVIDALDECDPEEDAKRIIELLAKAEILPGFKLKFFLTSRPEYHIRLGFDKLKVGSHKAVALHTIPEPVVEHDLSVYFVHQLALIRDEYNRLAPEEFHLPGDWPPADVIQKLVRIANPLFIFAATVCRLLEDMAPLNPAEELSNILMLPTETLDEKLTATYVTVLQRFVTGKLGSRMTGRQKDDIVSRFRNIIGSLVLLAEPLSVLSLAALLGVSPSTVDGIVNSLHSVLNVPRDLKSPVKIFHLSFREFLVKRDGDFSSDFRIDEEKINEELATKCLELLSSNDRLRYNMCNLEQLGKRRSNIPQKKVEGSFPPEVQYACLYWIHHLGEGKAVLRDEGQVHEFLKKHFLHWLEALSLMGRLTESTRQIQKLQTLVDPNEGIKITEFLRDATRFILRFRAIGDEAPLQFYSSALLFAPRRSVIKKTFQKHIEWIRQKPNVETDWDPCLQTLEGRIRQIQAVAFSRDGLSIAHGGNAFGLSLWDTTTGELRYMTRITENFKPESFTFSRDGQLVACAIHDCTVKLRSVATGEVQHRFQGHTDKVLSIEFSSDNASMVSGSRDWTVKVWDLATGTLRLSLEAHTDPVYSVACANNGRLIASGSFDQTIILWDASTGELQRTLKGHGDISKVVFSPDSKLLASGSEDKSVRVWDVESGALQLSIQPHDSYLLSILDFSSDSKFIALRKGRTVVIRDMVLGRIHQTLKGHSVDVKCVAYSPSGGLLATATRDAVKIWDTSIRSLDQSPEGHSQKILSLALSPDSRLVASASCDSYIKVWNAANGKLKYSLPDRTDREKPAVIFSPDSTLIASISDDDSIKLRDAKTGKVLQTLKTKRQTYMYQTLAFSPDSQLLAVSVGSIVVVWNIGDGGGAYFELYKNSDSETEQLVFSPGSTFIAASTCTNTYIWDVEKRWLLHTLTRPSRMPLWMGFSPDSRVLGLRFEGNGRFGGNGRFEVHDIFEGNGRNIIQIWDILKGVLVQTYQDCGSATFKTVFSADSKRLEVTSWDKYHELVVREELNCEVGTPDSSSTSGNTTLLVSQVELSKSRSYRVDEHNSWIQLNGQNLLWIPPDHRPTKPLFQLSPDSSLRTWVADNAENRIIIGSPSGRVTFIEFDS
ncbi:unnamed protein product [Clonostachys byssicola]|uniref:NACHT domain-containing protein n=1 Tax=Clonostachys byssicola TaxID=160290 RepID=A0A9N9Y2L5_9HYPO|nr:unnamed protein product [Clonostachys byssicola]